MSLPPSSHASSRGQVTVEDADDDDYEFGDEDETAHAPTAKPTNGAGSQSKSKEGGPDNTNRGALSPGTESAFEVWLRKAVNEPILSVLPEWVQPNWISYINTTMCWCAMICSILAYRYEHLYPEACMYLRFLMGAFIFSGITLDCLDGMQARKTGRTSKLGEVLDHSLDAANVPLVGCSVLITIFPDPFTLVVSAIGGSMIYNAQLVIYRHHHVFVLPPLTGPAAQALLSLSGMAFGVFFYYFDRHSYGARVVVIVFTIGANLASLQNCWFYFQHLTRSFDTSCLMPHVRFTVVCFLHGGLVFAGYLTEIEYVLSFVMLAYRLNGRYVLDTLLGFRTYSKEYTKDSVAQRDTSWRPECVAMIAALYAIGFTLGTGASSGESLIGLSLFHAALYFAMAMGLVLNVSDLVKALPTLEQKA